MTDARVNARLKQYSGMPASAFLLHRDPMLLLDRLVESRDDYTMCEWQVIAGNPFVLPSLGTPAHIGVEFMAQCIGVHAGARARVDGFGPPLGFLLGTRHYKSSASWFGEGTICQVTCKELIRDSTGMGSYDCSILLQDVPIAEARLSVLEKERGRYISD
jgi:predicted hotdog family 3-hydroxylacyl-ACP dehydratase